MKLVRLMQVSSLAAVGALSSVNVSAEETAAPAATAATPAVAAPSYTDEQVFEAFGYLVGQRIGISEFNLTEAEKAAALRGLDAAFSGTKDKFNPETFGPEIQRVLGGRQQAAAAKAAKSARKCEPGCTCGKHRPAKKAAAAKPRTRRPAATPKLPAATRPVLTAAPVAGTTASGIWVVKSMADVRS